MKKDLTPLLFIFFIVIFETGCSKNNTPPDNSKTIPPVSGIIYTDIRDSVIIDTTRFLYNLDLNNDGIADFTFTEKAFPASRALLCRNQLPGTGYSVKINSATGSNNEFKSRLDFPYPFDSMTVIDSTGIWVNDTVNDNHNLLYLMYTGPPAACNSGEGLWNHYITDQYLGLKFISNGKVYYGWARLSYTNPISLTLKDYAFNSVAGQSILAGQMK